MFGILKKSLNSTNKDCVFIFSGIVCGMESEGVVEGQIHILVLI